MATVLIAEALSPATLDALGDGFEISHVDGANRDELLPALADVDAVLIRSATRMDAEAIAAAPHLKVIARAGVGLDNVDVPAATEAGVMVVNAPTSNIISAAELTIGHILSLARHIPQANDKLKEGVWARSQYTGTELYEKTLGVIGLGRIGALVTERLQSFGMKVIAYDPYISAQQAAAMGVELVELDDLLKTSDFVTMHMPKTPTTIGMIGAEQLEMMKESAYIVNVARGGLIDEQALADALKNNKIAGAGIDVYDSEPETNAPFFASEKSVVTPHLGASTEEAQEKAGISVAQSVRLALNGEIVPDAVNVSGGALDEAVRPMVPLMENLGRVLTSLSTDDSQHFLRDLSIDVKGSVTEHDVKVLELAALKGIFKDISSEAVSYVNAPLMAQQREIDTQFNINSDAGNFRNLLSLSAVSSNGTRTTVAGTLTGMKKIPKLVNVNGLDVEVPLDEHIIVVTYDDKPGAVGRIGQILGDENINIAGMQITEDQETADSDQPKALAILRIDGVVSQDVLNKIQVELPADSISQINLEN